MLFRSPFNNHSLVFKKLKYQINWTNSIKNKLWKLIIQEKIKSEVANLNFQNKNHAAKILIKKYGSVKLNDKFNYEAMAARFYFSVFFGDDFKRKNDDIINVALNYGYKIIASYISRSISARGYLTQLGIHQIGEANPFNLTYDFIESFRAIIDRWVYINMYDKESFEINDRYELANILNIHVFVENKKYRLNKAIDLIIDSYFSFLNKESIEIKTFDYENIIYETN